MYIDRPCARSRGGAGAMLGALMAAGGAVRLAWASRSSSMGILPDQTHRDQRTPASTGTHQVYTTREDTCGVITIRWPHIVTHNVIRKEHSHHTHKCGGLSYDNTYTDQKRMPRIHVGANAGMRACMRTSGGARLAVAPVATMGFTPTVNAVNGLTWPYTHPQCRC